MCDPDDAAYWSEGNVPVILVCSHPKTGEAWWAPVTEILKDPDRRQTRRIDFDKQRDRLDESAASALLDLAAPSSGALYVPAPHRPERLTSNLLSVGQTARHDLGCAGNRARERRSVGGAPPA